MDQVMEAPVQLYKICFDFMIVESECVCVCGFYLIFFVPLLHINNNITKHRTNTEYIKKRVVIKINHTKHNTEGVSERLLNTKKQFRAHNSNRKKNKMKKGSEKFSNISHFCFCFMFLGTEIIC